MNSCLLLLMFHGFASFCCYAWAGYAALLLSPPITRMHIITPQHITPITAGIAE